MLSGAFRPFRGCRPAFTEKHPLDDFPGVAAPPLNPFRAVNFQTDEEGNLICPNGKKFQFSHRKPVKGNKYGRQEEIYQCEDCTGCPYAAQCKKGEGNRTVSLNEELTAIHQEVLYNLESIHGALLRMNRSIQAEGSFGIMKYDRWYKRIVRKDWGKGIFLRFCLFFDFFESYRICRAESGAHAFFSASWIN